MSNITWSLVIPTVIAILGVNAIITICVTNFKSNSGGKKISSVLITILTLLLFISLFCVLVWIMYSTPARFLFNAIDHLVNSVVSGIPRILVLLWFVIPLTLAYLICAGMATWYDFKKRKEFKKGESKPTHKHKLKLKKKHFKHKNKDDVEKVPVQQTIGEILDNYVISNDIDKAIKFRRFINESHDGICGIKYADQYWLIVHNVNEFSQLQNDIPLLLNNASATEFPAVINATTDQATVDTEQHAINAFRKLTRKVN